MLFRLLVASICLSAIYAAPIERDQATDGDKQTASLSDESCGLTPIEPLLNSNKQIETAQPHSWPWVVALCLPDFYNETEIDCTNFKYGSGTVVGSRWVLTTFKGQSDWEVGDLQVRTGVHNWLSSSEEDPGSRLHHVFLVYEYPYERNFTIDGGPFGSVSMKDETPIVLLELSTDIHFDETVQPVCLAAHDDTKDGWLTGWRRSYVNGPATDTSMSQLHVGAWSYDTEIPQDYGSVEGHAGSYEWGAPLVKKHDSGRWFQHGMLTMDTSFTANYARVPRYCDWIEEATDGEVKCQ